MLLKTAAHAAHGLLAICQTQYRGSVTKEQTFRGELKMKRNENRNKENASLTYRLPGLIEVPDANLAIIAARNDRPVVVGEYEGADAVRR